MRKYIIGIGGFAVVYIVVGVLTLISLLLTLCFICCCRKRKNASGEPSCCSGCRCRPRTFCYAPYWWAVWAAALFVIVSIGLAEAVYMRTALSDTVSAITGLGNAFIGIGAAVTGNPLGLSPALQALASSLTTLQTTMQSSSVNAAYPAAAPQISPMISSTNAAASSASSLGTDITSVGNNLKAAFEGGNVNINNLSNQVRFRRLHGSACSRFTSLPSHSSPLFCRLFCLPLFSSQQVFLASIIPLALFLAYLFFFGLTLSPTKCGACTFRLCNIILLPVLFLVFLFSAVFIFVSFFGSDLCYAPNSVINNVLNATDPTGMASSTVGFYTGCQNPQGVYAPLSSSSSPAIGFLIQGNQTFANTTVQFQQFQAQMAAVPSPQDPNVNTAVLATSSSLTAGQSSMNNVLNSASCASINNPFNNLLITLCGPKGIGAMAVLWATGTAACVFIFLMAVCGVPICLQHPGDEETKEQMERFERNKAGLSPASSSNGDKTYANMAPAQQGGWGTVPAQGQQQGVQMAAVGSGAPAAYV